VDLLLELENGFVALECKMTEKTDKRDIRNLRGLGDFLPKPLLAGIVISNDQAVKDWGNNIYSLPVLWALAPIK